MNKYNSLYLDALNEIYTKEITGFDKLEIRQKPGWDTYQVIGFRYNMIPYTGMFVIVEDIRGVEVAMASTDLIQLFSKVVSKMKQKLLWHRALEESYNALVS
jgi:hypothetical protein